MNEVKLQVPDMSCDHCIHTVTKAAQAAGAETVQIDLDSKQVAVHYDASKVNEQQIRDAIEESGYPVAA